jgi:integrase/recombinase XerC
VEEAIAAFLRYLDRERNASPHTQRAYRQDLVQFTSHACTELGHAVRATEVDHLLVRSFLAGLHRQGLSKVSAARKLASLRAFFRYLCREGIVERNPARALLSPRVARRIPTHLSEADVAQIVDFPTERESDWRTRAILELLSGAGLRDRAPRPCPRQGRQGAHRALRLARAGGDLRLPSLARDAAPAGGGAAGEHTGWALE